MSPESAPTLNFLGGAVIQVGGSPLGGPAAHRHRLALLALLALNPRPVSRDKLLALLWPERDAEHGRNLLKVAVHELRKLLGEQVIRTTGDQLSLDPSAIRCDVIEFEAAILTNDLEKAVALYAGPLLDGFFLKDAAEFERWVDGERTRLTDQFAQTLRRLAIAADEQNDSRSAARWWRALATHDPVRADVALNLMQALAASGDRSGAIRHAEIHAAIRRDEFGIDPDPAVFALSRQLRESPTTPTSVNPYDRPVLPRSSIRPPSTDALPRRRATRPSIVIAIVAVALLIAASVRNRIASKGNAVAPNLVAVLPFRVVGSDTSLAYLREGMMDMLAARITGDGGLRAVDNRQALAAWRSAASATGEISLASALRLSRDLGAGRLLLGEAVAEQKGVEVSATLYRVPNGDVLARARRVVGEADTLTSLVDQLAAELMSRAAGEPEDRLADLTHRALPALRPYLAGEEAYRGGQYARAESLFAKALDVDRTFPLAGMGLALANSWTSINEHYGIGRDAALRGQASLSARDRMFLKAFFGPDPAIGQPQVAPVYLEAWEDVVHHWPDWAEAWYNLGDRYYHFGGLSGGSDPLDHARAAFVRSLELDTAFTAPLHHLVEIYVANGDAANVKTTGDRYFEHNPGVARDASAIGWSMAMALHDERWLARIRANLDSMPTSDLARMVWITEANGWAPDDADRALAALDRHASATYERESALLLRHAYALNAGRPSEARAAAAAHENLFPDQPTAALLELYAAIFGGGDTTLTAAAVTRLEPFASAALSGNPDRRARQVQAQCLIGFVKSRHGDAGGARAMLRKVQSEFAGSVVSDGPAREGRMCAAWLSASIAVDEHAADASRLVAQLDSIVLRDRVPPRMALTAGAIMSTRLHERLGQVALALASSRWRENYTGAPVFLSTQLRDEGDLARMAGDTVSAIRAYRHFLALRAGAEPGAASEATSAVRKALQQIERR